MHGKSIVNGCAKVEFEKNKRKNRRWYCAKWLKNGRNYYKLWTLTQGCNGDIL